MNPAVAGARTGVQMGLGYAIVATVNFAPGDEPRRMAASIVVGSLLTAAQWVLENKAGWKLGVKRSDG